MQISTRIPLDDLLFLSDKGINEAIRQGLITGVEHYPEDLQGVYRGPINPASIDLSSKSEVGISAFQRRPVEYLLPSIPSWMVLEGDIKSRLRRLGLRCSAHSPFENSFTLYNLTSQNYVLEERARFCHIFIGGGPNSQIRDFSHGYPLISKEQVSKVIKNGHLTVKKGKIEISDNGLLVLHASGKMKEERIVNPLRGGEIKSSDNVPKPTYIPLQSEPFKPNSLFTIAISQILALSPHVAIQQYNIGALGELQLGGIVDPGYEGGTDSHGVLERSRIIREGDPVSVGRIIFFPEGTLIPYGDRRRDSSFQRQGYLFTQQLPSRN